jgi:hypothetical protein
MNLHRRHCGKLHRFIVQHLGIPPANIAAAFLSITCLAALALFLIFAGCAPNPTKPSPHVRLIPTVTDTLTPTVHSTPTSIPKPTLLPPVTLEEPEDGACLACEQEVTLCWSCPRVLQTEEYYRLRVKGQTPSPFYHTVYHKEDHSTLPTLSPGKYDWSVAIVRSTAQDNYELVSEESDSYSFEIALPTPIVHSVSPTNTVQGTSVAVVVGGENFARSHALTIGIPLQATFVNSSTITATIPITLEAGEYPVVVNGSAGVGASSVSFTVKEPSPTPTPTPVSTTYPPPKLIGMSILGKNVTFKWTWSRELAEDEYFAVRVGIGAPGDSRCWTKETQFTCPLKQSGEYIWEVAICRGDPAEHICEELAVTRGDSFCYGGCGKNGKKPPPPE